MKLSDANLDDLQGMPDVDFDFGVSSALVAAFRAAASKLEGQQGSRVLFRRNAGEGFEGFYAQRFFGEWHNADERLWGDCLSFAAGGF